MAVLVWVWGQGGIILGGSGGLAVTHVLPRCRGDARLRVVKTLVGINKISDDGLGALGTKVVVCCKVVYPLGGVSQWLENER